MTPEQETVPLIKGSIASLPPADAEACEEVADHIRRVVECAGPAGVMALALVGAEFAAK